MRKILYVVPKNYYFLIEQLKFKIFQVRPMIDDPQELSRNDKLTMLTLSIQYQLSRESVENLIAIFSKVLKGLPKLYEFKLHGGSCQLGGIGPLLTEIRTIFLLTIRDVSWGRRSRQSRNHKQNSYSHTDSHDKTIDSMVESIESLASCASVTALNLESFNLTAQNGKRFFEALKLWKNLERINLSSGSLQAKPTAEDTFLSMIDTLECLKKVSLRPEFDFPRRGELNKRCKRNKFI